MSGVGISLVELQKYTDLEIERLLSHVAAERGVSYWADNAYCMCLIEMERRHDSDKIKHIDVKCIHNIFSESQEYIFRLGNRYLMHQLDEILVVYDGRMLPYRFTTAESDQKCIWNYFTLWKDGKFWNN